MLQECARKVYTELEASTVLQKGAYSQCGHLRLRLSLHLPSPEERSFKIAGAQKTHIGTPDIRFLIATLSESSMGHWQTHSRAARVLRPKSG